MKTQDPSPGFERASRHLERGATSVEYAVIIVLIILAVSSAVFWLADPTDPDNSLLPTTYSMVSDKVGNFGSVSPSAE